MAGSLHNVAATAKERVPASVNHCNSSPDSSLTLPLYWHLFSLTVSDFPSHAFNIFIGPALPDLSSRRKFIIICCTKLWQLNRKGWSVLDNVLRNKLFFKICLHNRLWRCSRNLMCSVYSRKLMRNRLHAAKSARPTTPATASVCIGWAANVKPATAVPTLMQ